MTVLASCDSASVSHFLCTAGSHWVNLQQRLRTRVDVVRCNTSVCAMAEVCLRNVFLRPRGFTKQRAAVEQVVSSTDLFKGFCWFLG